ncbi:MAG: hypothetical protein M0Z83_10475 [Betaproteobacteria bacterium]|nr:hypothetical protein [Betaproteobacteria bacterium]
MIDEESLIRDPGHIEKDMLATARHLESERTAELRDQLRKLKLALFGVGEQD